MSLHAQKLRVLLIEDEVDHAELIRRQLSLAHDCRIETRCCGRLDDGLHELESATYDALLLDMRLPDSDLPETVQRAAAAAPAVPIVVLTSLGDTEVGVRAMQDGAQDYLVKTQITPDMLVRSLRYAIERKRVRLELERYAQELERSNRELEQFARIVSHDLKSPLAVVQMDLMQLRDKAGKLSEEALELLASADEQVQHACDLIDAILRLARLQQAPQESEPVDVEAVFTQVAEMLQPDIERVGATVTHDQLPSVKGQAATLSQLFQNLLINALKYRSAAPPVIHVSADLFDHDWVFSVADNGLGVPPEDRERIFGMFERAHHATHDGIGIGLATCKRIVERHGGRIWVSDNLDGGSIFYFTLPLAEAAQRVHAGAVED